MCFQLSSKYTSSLSLFFFYFSPELLISMVETYNSLLNYCDALVWSHGWVILHRLELHSTMLQIIIKM